MTYEDILARMRKGESADDIADEMAKMLNKAQKQVAEEEKANEQENEFMQACNEAAEAMNYALDVYGAWKNINVGELAWDADMCAMIVQTVVGFGDLISTFNVKPAGPTEVKKPKSNDETFDDVVARFLRANNIK